jgi:hypothetical protein
MLGGVHPLFCNPPTSCRVERPLTVEDYSVARFKNWVINKKKNGQSKSKIINGQIMLGVVIKLKLAIFNNFRHFLVISSDK